MRIPLAVPATLRHTCCWLVLALAPPGMHARAAAQPVQRLEIPAPASPAMPALEPPGPMPLQVPGSTLPPPLEPAGQPQPAPLSITRPDDPALADELARLRASASHPAKRGSAAEKQAARAAWTLGLLALHGQGGPVDLPQAQQWFERARTLGEPLANAGLAWCRIDGCIPPPDPASARPYIAQLRATDAGRALYLEWLAQARRMPLQTPQPRPSAASAQPGHALLARAAQAGDAQALVELGMENIALGRLQEALAQFRQAAGRSPAAAANAGRLAARLASMDAAQRPPTARSAQDWFVQARRYHRGDGVPANYAEAVRLYQVAAAAGSRPAQHMLGLISARPSSTGGVDIAWMQQLATLDVEHDQGTRALPAQLPTLPAVSPQLYVHDPTPLYDLLPAHWRTRP